MRKSGFLMLLLVCFLAFMPVVAFAYNPADSGIEQIFTNSDLITKIEVKGDVFVFSGERKEAPACSIQEDMFFQEYGTATGEVFKLEVQTSFVYIKPAKIEAVPYFKNL